MHEYINYLEQVLGIKSLVWPQSEAPVAPVEPEAPRAAIQVLFVAEKPWSEKAYELFQKMREAMKLQDSDVKILFASQVHLPELQVSALSAERVVCFSPRLMEQISVEPSVKYLTHDPEELLRSPALKKPAWEELKKVMKSLGLL